MVGLNICDKEKIDTSSITFKNLIAQSLTNYILDNWNECIKVDSYIANDHISNCQLYGEYITIEL